jgi:hypothetical protein
MALIDEESLGVGRPRDFYRAVKFQRARPPEGLSFFREQAKPIAVN